MMRRQPKLCLTLRMKVVGVTVALTTISLAAVATTGILQFRGQIADEQRRAADSVALGVARAAERAMMVRDEHELARIANSFLHDPEILFIAAYGEGPRPLAAAVRDQASWSIFQHDQSPASAFVVGERIVEKSDRGDDLSSPSHTDPSGLNEGMPDHSTGAQKRNVAGRVVVGLSMASARAAEARQTQLTIAFTSIAAAIGAVLLFVTLSPWIRRLQALNEASEAMAGGNFNQSIEDDHADELGKLAGSFEAMRLQLRERDHRLREFTETLQDQVHQRTADLRTALSVAEEASRAKSMFLANMSHELRTPLNGVIGMVDLLLAAGPSPQQRRYCEIAKSSAHSLLELINDILDFSKIEAGKLELDAADFDLHDVIENVTQMLGERADQKGLELACRVDHDLPRAVRGDGGRLRQVLVNLVANALKFTERGGVTIEASTVERSKDDLTIRVSVKDTGIGIPQDRVDRLFKSFSQIDASTTRRFGGTGLGLAISQRIIEMMGGHFEVQSEEGKGSTFSFTACVKVREASEPKHRDLPVDPRGLRALAVDDSQTNREILQAQLASWKLRSDVADGAEQALELLRSAAKSGEPYRFAILDIHMPKIDGIQLAKEIKADPQICDVILISLSSISDHLKPTQMQQIGFARSLSKPALPSQLYNAIVDSLATRGAPAQHVTEETAAEMTTLDGVRVLLAEDNEINRMVASELLENVGCHVTAAINGREAMDRALREDFDVILMDCQMPELDGFEATRLIREHERAAAACGDGRLHRKIIALTANAIKGDRERCLQAGMDAYVTKPIDPDLLFSTIRTAVAGRVKTDAFAVMAHANDTVDQSIDAPSSDDPAREQSLLPPIDVEALRKRCMGNRKIASKALSKFESASEQDITMLVEGVKQRDAKQVAAAAHKIKGAAANISAEGVRQIAAQLEQLARADTLEQAEGLLDDLQQQMTRFKEFLAEALRSLGSGDPGAEKIKLQ